MSPLFSMPFLGSALSSPLVYIWSRRNPDTRLSFLGLMVFTAPYLPWVLMAFSLVLHGVVPKDEMAGVVVGHGAYCPLLFSLISSTLLLAGTDVRDSNASGAIVFYFFADLYPPLHNNHRPLDPPLWYIRLFERLPPSATETATETDAAEIRNEFAAAAAPEVR